MQQTQFNKVQVINPDVRKQLKVTETSPSPVKMIQTTVQQDEEEEEYYEEESEYSQQKNDDIENLKKQEI